MMHVHICCACGTSYPPADEPPACCPVCEDDRQFVPAGGQKWVTPAHLASRHDNSWRQHEPNLFEIRTRPHFGIGQRAFLLQTPAGNILWDCIALLDDATERIVHALGGLSAIAISHPHYYTTMQDWARAFDVPVHLHEADRAWVMRPDSHLHFWQGDQLDLTNGVTLLRLGGHFPGGTVLHSASGADGRGLLLSGDIVQVAPDTSKVSFMWSYPNMLPLPAATVQGIDAALAGWEFDRVYGAFAGRQILAGANQCVRQSAARYVALLDGSAREN